MAERSLDFISRLRQKSSAKRKDIEHRRVWFVAIADPGAPETEQEIYDKKLPRGDTQTRNELREIITSEGTTLTAQHGAINKYIGEYDIKPQNAGVVLKGVVDEIGRYLIIGYCDGSQSTSAVRRKIFSGEFRDVSMTIRCNVVNGKCRFTMDSIALVPKGRKNGTHILYATNGKREMNRLTKTSIESLKILVDEVKEEAQKQRLNYQKSKGKNLKINISISTCINM